MWFKAVGLARVSDGLAVELASNRACGLVEWVGLAGLAELVGLAGLVGLAVKGLKGGEIE